MYCIRVKGTLNRRTSKLNCCSVVRGYSFWSEEAFCNLSALKRQVYDVTAANPVPAESNQDYQSKLAIAPKPLPMAKMMMSEVIKTPQLRYQETTASWNFFILRMEMEPPAVKNGLRKRAP